MNNEQDIPYLDDTIAKLPSDMRDDLAELGKRDLYWFNKAVLKHRDLTQSCHGPICIYFDSNPGQFKLALYPRDHLKTHCITIAGCLQKGVRNPNERILILNESATNAERMLSAIQTHCESNRVFRALYSSVIPKDTRKVRWNQSELDFVRDGIFPEPTFDTIGMTGGFTSRHYSHICIDDPISDNAMDSEKVMNDAINRLKGCLDLLTNPEKDTIWIVGTRWAIHDAYSWFEKTLGTRLTKMIRGVIEDGQPIWPERFSLETLALKRVVLGEYKWSTQQMNNPRNMELQDVNVQDIKFWRWAEKLNTVELLNDKAEVEETWPLSRLDIVTTVDLAMSEKTKDDRNAVVTCGITPSARCVVLDAWGKRCTPLQVIDKLFEVKAKFHPRVYGIEGVAYQKALKYFVQQEALRRDTYLHIQDLKAPGHDKKHIRSIQPIAATGRLYMLPTQMLLRQELADYPLGEFDDVADAMGLQSQLWRGQMSNERWEKLRKQQQEMVRKVMNKERYGTDTMQSSSAFDTDDENQDDLPGKPLERHMRIAS